MDDEVLSLLSLVASDYPGTSERASQSLIAISSIFPEKVFAHLSDFRLVLASLCAANCVRWGTVSSIFLVFANAINTNPFAVEPHVVELIEMSKMVTQAYLFTPPLNSGYRPHLLPFVHALSKAFCTNVFRLNLEMLLALSDHCAVGFVPNASYIPMMVTQTNDILQLMKNSEPIHYERLCDPISSTDMDVVLFYVSVWAILVGKMCERPTIFHALSRKMKWLVQLVAENRFPYVMPARYIVDFVKASQREAEELVAVWKTVSESAFNTLDTLRRPTRPEVDAAAEKEAEAKEAEKKARQAPLQTVVEVVKGQKSSGKKGQRHDLFLLPEIDLLMWSRKGREAKDGDAIFRQDITDIEIVQSRTSEGEKCLRVSTKKSGVIMFDFTSYSVAVQWKKYLEQMK